MFAVKWHNDMLFMSKELYMTSKNFINICIIIDKLEGSYNFIESNKRRQK